ncbi:ATP synthase F0 subunit A [Paraflavitalea soli]|uniref:ATP synthase subunit a n=1 Tax=Paraflavitalea soli TaxID=2315862 RepID=A0A3B7MTW1_9BACT|nr:F0F1 ATP synthase subunit A [Paraflavitalea soli]AXY77297.1 ATP synthase F0 subunit A [Paraflavitalea soli]
MAFKRFKSLSVAVFSLFLVLFSSSAMANEGKGAEGKFDPGKEMLDHIADAHEFHFFTIKHEGGHDFHATLPLPVILYSPQRGLSVFMSSKFHHGEEIHNGYKLVEHDIIPVKEDGSVDESVKVFDFSLTKNVVQMFLALTILFLILTGMAKKYKKGQGLTSAPKGLQNAIEPVILFVRDDVARPNLGVKADKYLPYLLTLFFFILVNNLFGLLPGSANVTGNIAFTMVLGIIAFVVILFSTNAHYWGHIFWYPGVPVGVKFLMLPVELMGVFTKPFALIIRLFANMTAGHIIILSFVSLIFIFGEMTKTAGIAFTPVSIAFAVFIYLIEVLVAFIQAYIFTTLTAVFISQAIGDHHYEEDPHH